MRANDLFDAMINGDKKEVGLREVAKIMIGGPPVTQEYADSIEVEGFAEDASRAARMAKERLVHASRAQR